MISAEERKALKKDLGYNYAPRVIRILNEKGLKNSRGNEYSTNSIRQIFNGYDENLDIELAIYQLRDDIREKKAALQKARAASHS